MKTLTLALSLLLFSNLSFGMGGTNSNAAKHSDCPHRKAIERHTNSNPSDVAINAFKAEQGRKKNKSKKGTN